SPRFPPIQIFTWSSFQHVETAQANRSPALDPSLTPSSGILRGRRVLSFAPGAHGDAVWWQDGRLVAVGRAEDLARRAPKDTPVHDLPGALITPGFVDGQTHFAMWALNRR